MASFHKHYASMQGQPNGHPFAENVLVSTAEPPVESFSSDVAFLLPCDASHQYNKSSPSPGANSENPSTLKSATLKRKHSVMSKLFKHNHGLLVHRLGKEKNVFSPQQTKFSSQEDEALCTMNMDKQTAVREIYTILANGYNIYSLHYPPQWRPAAKVWKSNKQHAAHRDVVSESPFITAIINSWSYGPAKQVYATKVVDELKEIVNEYHVWLQRAPANLVDVGFMAPRLFLEWPKSWAFSTI